MRHLLVLAILVAGCHPIDEASLGDSAEIVNGRAAPKGAYPWMVQVQTMRDAESAGFCGGSLLDPTHVVTAAHCVAPGDTNIANVVSTLAPASAVSVESRPDGGAPVSAQVATVYVHPQYDLGTFTYDVAVLTLTTPIEVAVYAKLASEVTVQGYRNAGKPVRAIGYGDTEGGGETDVLLETDLKLLDDAACKQRGYLGETSLCAGPLSGETAICQGDSGGPLLGPGSNTLVGISSYGKKKCDGISYFASLAASRSWIAQCLTEACPKREAARVTTCNVAALDCKPEVAGCDTLPSTDNCGECGTICGGAMKCGWLEGSLQCIPDTETPAQP